MRHSRLHYVLGHIDRADDKEYYWNSREERWDPDWNNALIFKSKDKAGEYARSYWLQYWANKGIAKVAIISVQIETAHVIEIKTKDE